MFHLMSPSNWLHNGSTRETIFDSHLDSSPENLHSSFLFLFLNRKLLVIRHLFTSSVRAQWQMVQSQSLWMTNTRIQYADRWWWKLRAMISQHFTLSSKSHPLYLFRVTCGHPKSAPYGARFHRNSNIFFFITCSLFSINVHVHQACLMTLIGSTTQIRPLIMVQYQHALLHLHHCICSKFRRHASPSKVSTLDIW